METSEVKHFQTLSNQVVLSINTKLAYWVAAAGLPVALARSSSILAWAVVIVDVSAFVQNDVGKNNYLP